MNTAISAHSDAAFYRNRQAMLVYPLIAFPFLVALFWILGGGKGDRYVAQEVAASREGANGFNAKVPTAKSGTITGRQIDNPAYGKAAVGQVLSSFTNTKQDSASQGLRALPVDKSADSHVSSLAATPAVTRSVADPATGSARSRSTGRGSGPSAAAVAATGTSRKKGYYYNPPGPRPYYSQSATDQQVDQQLQQYERSRAVPLSSVRSSSGIDAPGAMANQADARPATVRVTDNVTASRLTDAEVESPFLTAPTGGSRPQPTRAVLSGGNYGTKKAIAWMIPVVVHEDQLLRDGEQVKLRLLKEITADGVTIPANTILYALCQLSNDRLRLTVRNLQLGGQLIPLDLDVYDTDGSAGINVPGLSQSGQIGGQVRSSAIQGIQVPGVGGLATAVLNSARQGASQSARQTSIRLRAGYNLFLKAQ